MGFGQAISSGFNNITNFEGRSSRPAFWYFYLFVIIVNFIGVLGLFYQLGAASSSEPCDDHDDIE